ncbi:hypothetical protein [Peribacillus asahii]|uniref:hypothetical protein n=1 Tax=Peribacillus asahii TaxID=228899 RepID=UPI00381E5D6F
MMDNTFEFSDLLEEYSVPFVAYEKRDGDWADNGDWVPTGKLVPIHLKGAIFPLTKDDLQYAENGTYSVKDRKIYTTHVLEVGQRLQYKNITYTIQGMEDYSDYMDINVYYARWAGDESSSG